MSIIKDVHDLRTAVHTTIANRQDKEERVFGKILDELRAAGGEFAKHAVLAVEILNEKLSGQLTDDRHLLIEKIIRLISKLPSTSFARRKITEILVDKLWDSLHHPPLTYVGEQYQYRQADGSHNNIMYPDLGKAGTPYARTVRSETKSPGAKPDPGLLFDLLMSRGDDFSPNEAGISSMLFYHASIITHDIFHTNRKDANISDTSSYLDLAPLYGSNQEQQNQVRSFINGELKPDTFHEKRLLGFPPGVNVMLVMYSRFHNHAARQLAAINEGGRFTAPRHMPMEEGMKWRDEQIFQTARLITNGLYVNISLHDYLRAIANVPATDSDWTLDPRVKIKKIFNAEGVPQGVGNQVSCEFNLLYRFHSAISDRDAKWTKEFYKKIFPGQDPLQISMPVLFQGIKAFEESIPEDPSVRTFADIKRNADGTFRDEDLVQILKESIEDPAGRFGANHVPDILKPVEILGIIQARKWQCASLNEFRKFFKLKPYEKFEDINDDPYVAKTLERVYGNVDNVEMYPGMFLESTKPKMDAGMGLCAPYTVSRAVFSDAIVLVRGDRFLTLDYTPANLTNWGITEAASDYKTLGGAKMHHLILNAFPNHIKFNSVYAMQPFYTPTKSKEIFEKLGVADKYSFDAPSANSRLIPITSLAGLKQVLSNKQNFRVPWGAKMSSLESYMLASDRPECAAQREVVKDALYGPNGSLQNFATYSEEITRKLLKREAYELGRKGVHQVDIVKDISNLAALHFAAELCYLPLETAPNGSGKSYTEEQLYKVLCDITTYVFSDADPTRSWARRRDAQEGTAKLCAEMERIVQSLPPAAISASANPTTPVTGYAPKTMLGKHLAGRLTAANNAAQSVGAAEVGGGCPVGNGPLGSYGINMARKLVASGRSAREVAEILVGTASAFVANTATAFAQLIDFYLEKANEPHWNEIKKLSAENSAAADEKLTKYVLEGFRLSNTLGIARIAVPDSDSVSVKDHGVTVTAKKGDRLFISFVATSRDPLAFPSPNEIKLDRPIDNYVTFGEGPHQCLGKDLNIVHSRAMLKVLARLPGLRRTPGEEGHLKFVPKPGGLKVYLTPDWSEYTPYPTTMKLMWDGAPPS
ncbi:heme peroxidase [Pyronema domesticum]|uniref:linoleate 8R-lipoxygenase n=1 Tax=Pyronema omphalodes (strain CBS 100304) TaxID=1076935 RepID=U4LD56_PYROM|nr:heme peroxidase [Pyronema domesticum]CCX12338.1 Similar to Psi-producing oxygenase A; acc. no. B0Y6R2 [Pyronema omphalodes CBS 100304]